MLPTDEDFSSELEMTTIVGVNGVGLDGQSELVARRAFFEEEGSITIDSNKLLSCLSRNPVLKMVVISSSSSSLQVIEGTNRLSNVPVSSLEEEDDEKKKKKTKQEIEFLPSGRDKSLSFSFG